MSVQVLVVEDDDRIRAVLRLALEGEGYDVAESADAESALAGVSASMPDLMIVDLMLGRMDSYACIREVRKISDLPIIVVSARSDTHDIVAGLEAGADDYVAKPFRIKEITARLRALRRRSRPAADSVEPDLVLDSDPTDKSEDRADTSHGLAMRRSLRPPAIELDWVVVPPAIAWSVTWKIGGVA